MLLKELQILTETLWESVKTDLKFFSPISSIVKRFSEFDFSTLDRQSLNEIKLYSQNIEAFFERYRSKGAGLYFPPTQTSNNEATLLRINQIVAQLDKMNNIALGDEILVLEPAKSSTKQPKGESVFIGHGRSKLWARVQLYLKDDLKLDTFSFETESHTSESIVEVLESLLSKSAFAILIITAEDETADGKFRARQNVIHEAGLFQGRLGFDKVVLLKQDLAEELSNLAGLQYIPFQGDNIEQTFYELQRKMKKSGLLK